MNPLLYFTFILFFFTTISTAQPLNTDSLINVLKEMPNNTSKVDSFNATFKVIFRKDGERALNLARSAVRVGGNICYEKGIVQGYYNIGVIHYLFRLNVDSTFYYLHTALEGSKEIKDSLIHAKSCGLLGTLYDDNGNVNEAEKYFNISLLLFKALKNDEGVSKALNNMGGMYKVRGEYVKALSYYNASLALKHKLHDTLGIAGSYLNLGDLYRRKGAIDTASIYLERARIIYNQSNDNERVLAILNTKALIQAEYFKDYTKSRNLFEEALRIANKMSNKRLIGRMLTNIGNTYTAEKKYTKAKEYLLKSLELKQETEDKNGIASVFLGLAEIYFKTNAIEKAFSSAFQALLIYEETSSPQGQARVHEFLGLSFYKKRAFRQAIYHLTKARKIAQEVGLKLEEYYITESLADSYAAIEDFQSAFTFQKKHDDLRAELFKKEKLKLVAEADAKFQTERERAKAAESDAKFQTEQILREKNKTWFLTAIIIILIIGITISILLKRQRNKAVSEKKIAVQKVKDISKEKDVLKQKNIELIQDKALIQKNSKLYEQKVLKLTNHVIPLNEIKFIETQVGKKKISVHTVNEVYEEYTSLSFVSDILPNNIFIRIHRSHLVNLHFTETITSDFVVLKLINGKKTVQRLSIGKTYYFNLKEVFRKFHS